MYKYRLKLVNGRIVGPFKKEQVAELFLKGHISKEIHAQIFPTGDWIPVSTQIELWDYLSDIKSNPEKLLATLGDAESKTVVNISVRGNKKANTVNIHDKQTNSEVNIKNLSSENLEVVEKEDTNQFKEFKFEISPKKNEGQRLPKTNSQPSKNITHGNEKTVIDSKKSRNVDLDKTIIRPESIKYKEDERKRKLEEEEKLALENSERAEPEKIEEVKEQTENQSTRVEDLSDYLKEIRKSVEESEQEFIQQENDLIKAIDEDTKEDKISDTSKVIDSGQDQTPKKKSIKPIAAFAILALLYFLFIDDSEEKKSYEPLAVKIEFPVILENEDANKASEEYEKGKALLVRNDYPAKLYAVDHFKKSLGYKFKDNPSFGSLVLLYAELLPNASNEQDALKTIYRLLKIANVKSLSDINIAMASSLFYFHQGRYKTARNILENYKRVNKGLTPKFLLLWLDTALKTGDAVHARKLFEQISNIRPKNLEIYLSLARFYQFDQQNEEAVKILEEGSKLFKESVALLLEYAKLKLEAQDFKTFKNALQMIDALKAEYSPSYYAKYLEYMAILSAMNNDMNTALGFFKLAIVVKDSEELRSKLASLEVGGSNSVQNLILESKILNLMSKARGELDNKNWEQAIAHAISASDLSETYVPAKLLLAEIQIERGYYDFALKTLIELQKTNLENNKINYLLLYAFIEAYKIDDAQREISILTRSNFAKTYEYASLLGRFYHKQKNIPFAIRWYQESINRNPLNDRDYFKLAEILIYMKKFKDGAKMLADAMALDPDNIDYAALNAEILYEEKGPDTAIGYLREQLDKHLENPKLIGEIAKYYYKSGQTKFFLQYKEKMEGMTNRDPSFYMFLIESSRREDKFEDVVFYSKELLKIDPGNLNTRVELGEFYITNGKYENALQEFEQVKIRLPSYPKVNFYLSRSYYGIKNLEKAEEAALEEIKNNPNLEFGYIAYGRVLRDKSDWPNAIKNYETGISKNSKSVEALAGLAWIKAKQNNHAAARELYLRAIKEDQSNADLHRELAFCYKNMGQSGLAIESFQVYLTLSPNAEDRSTIEAEIKNLQ